MPKALHNKQALGRLLPVKKAACEVFTFCIYNHRSYNPFVALDPLEGFLHLCLEEIRKKINQRVFVVTPVLINVLKDPYSPIS